MTEKTYEEIKNDENIKSDKDLQNLVNQIEELKDEDQNNDKIEWVFSETPEWKEVNKSLNQWLTKSLEKHPEETKIISGEIKKFFRSKNLSIDPDIKNSLKPLWDLLDWINLTTNNWEIPEDALIPDNVENTENSPIDADFLKWITYDEIKELFVNPWNSSKIKDNLIIEKNWKKYVKFKWKMISTEWKIHGLIFENEQDLIYEENSTIKIWNNKCHLMIDKNKSNIIYWNKQEIIYNNWKHVEITKNPDKTEIRSANGIEMNRAKSRAVGKYMLKFEDKQDIELSMSNAHEKFLDITKILSLKKYKNKEKCIIINENQIKYLDNIVDFSLEGAEEAKKIAKLINEYKPNEQEVKTVATPKEPDNESIAAPKEPNVKPVEVPIETPEEPEQWKTEPIVDVDGLQGVTEVDFDNQVFTYEGTTYTFEVDEVNWKQTMIARTPDNHFYVVTKWPDSKLQFTNLEWFSWTSILDSATEITSDMEQYKKLMEEYNKEKDKYDADKAQYDNYKQDLEKYETAKAQYDIDSWRYQELKTKYNIDYNTYIKKYESYINNLPNDKKSIAWNIVKLNYQILTAEPSARDKYVKQAKKYRASLVIDRILG